MPRIRTIKPEFPQSQSMGNVSRDARLLFILLWTQCDDHGKARGSSRLLASLLYPYDHDVPGRIDAWLDELVRERCIVRYEADGASYVKVVKWADHQKIDRPSASKFPDPDAGSAVLATPREPSSPDQGPGIEGRDRGSEEAEGSARAAAAAATPAADDSPEGRAFAAWQEQARRHGWPDPMFLSSTRRHRLRAILAICGGLAGWVGALDCALSAEFLRTAEGGWQPWFHIDWMLTEEKFTRLMEGRYAERHQRNDQQQHGGLGATLAALGGAGAVG